MIGNVILLGGTKIEEILLGQARDTQPFPLFQSATLYPASSSLLASGKLAHQSLKNKQYFLKFVNRRYHGRINSRRNYGKLQ